MSQDKPTEAGTKTSRMNAIAIGLSVIGIVIVAYLAGYVNRKRRRVTMAAVDDYRIQSDGLLRRRSMHVPR